MGKKTTTFTELVVKGLMLFSIFTVLQGIDAFESINRIWLAIISVALAGRLLLYRYSLTEFMVLVVTAVLHVIALIFTDFPMYHTNMLFYFLMWVLLYLYFAKSKNKILEVLASSDRYITTFLWAWTLLVGVSAFLPSSYVDSYFYSFTDSSFRLMPSVLITTALAMYMIIKRNDSRYYLFLLVPLYAAFMNQSRTYFGVFLLFFIMFLYIRMKSRRMFYMALIPVCFIVLLVAMGSGIADKFAQVWKTGVTTERFLSSFTNARTIFWKWDLEAFFDLPFWQQFVGNGFDFAYEVTDSHGVAIWAHNDVINLLMNFGYIGVAIYTWSYFKMVKSFWPRKKAIPAAVRYLFHGAVFLNSMMNMSYTYFCAVISYPLFLCVISLKYGKENR